jgi:hypothetical protein
VLTVAPAGHTRDTTTRALAALGVAALGVAALGVAAQPLHGQAATAALAAAADPFDPPVPGPRAVPGIPITTTGR